MPSIPPFPCILIVSATEAEISPFRNYLSTNAIQLAPKLYQKGNTCFEFLITGVGIASTVYRLSRKLSARPYLLALQAGIGGSFSPNFPPGSLVLISQDQWGDLGAESPEGFLNAFDLGLADREEAPYRNGALVCPYVVSWPEIKLPSVPAITVHTTSGRQETVVARATGFGAVIESMEGAAFHYVCLEEQQPFLQLRAVSNRVTIRDRSSWEIPKAIRILNEWLISFSNQFEGGKF